MAGDVDVLGQIQLPRRVEPRSVPRQAAARSVHRRRRAARCRSSAFDDAHVPVLTAEALAHLRPSAAACSSTARSASAATRARCSKRARRVSSASIAIPTRSARARETLAPWGDRVELVHADYRTLDDVLDARGTSRQVDGALADLGVSSMQFDAPGRGFSFQRDEPLDMRMDRTTGETAADLVARSSERDLADAIFQYGEERFSRRIARALVEARARGAGRHDRPAGGDRPPRDPARAATCASIRRRGRFRRCASGSTASSTASIASSRRAARRLRAGARLVVITFHSLEDRIVKHTLRALQQRDGAGAGADEEAARAERRRSATAIPRARSAKLRAAERVA